MEVFIQMLKKKNEEIRQKKEEDLEFDLIDRRALRVAPVKIQSVEHHFKGHEHLTGNSRKILSQNHPTFPSLKLGNWHCDCNRVRKWGTVRKKLHFWP